jgi:ribosomal-protein-alanine N-acetyltransferase
MPSRIESVLRKAAAAMDTMIDLTWRPSVLETERLRLRPFELADAPALFALARNSNVTRFTLWEAHRTIDDTRAFVDDYARGSYLEGVPEPCAIELKEQNELIGAIGCRWAPQKDRCMELGYWIGEPFWGRGLTSEAARALLDHVFAAYPVERVQAHFIDGNAASGRVLEKIGMRFEGVRRHGLFHRERFWDLHCFATLRTDVRQ